MEAVSPKDRDTFESQIKRSKNEKADLDAFKNSWATMRKKTKAKQKPKAKAKAKAASKGEAKDYAPMGPVPEHVPTQASVRPWTPPHSYIWRANTTHRWYGRYKKNPTVSRGWEAHGLAHMEVLRELWRQHLFSEGLECPADCPVQDLFG